MRIATLLTLLLTLTPVLVLLAGAMCLMLGPTSTLRLSMRGALAVFAMVAR